MSNSLKNEIDLIAKLYYTGEFTKALNKIENLTNKANNDQMEYLELLIWKNRLSIKLGNYSEAIKKLDELIESIKNRELKELILEAILLKISVMSEIGNYNELISEINLGESLIKKLADLEQKKIFKTLFTFEKGKFYFIKNELETAKSIFIDSLNICSNLKLHYIKAEILINLCSIYRKENDFDTAFKYLNESLIICNENNYNFMKGKVFLAMGYIYNLKGNLHEALTQYQKSLILFNNIGSVYELGQINTNLGVINHFSGNLSSAYNYYKKALEYFQIVGNKNSLSSVTYNIGLIYNLQGKLKEALENYEESLPIFQELGNISQITACFNSMGKIYFDLGFSDKAEDCLRLVHQLKDKITKVSLSKTIFYLIPVLISQNKLNEAKKFMDELENICKKEKLEVIKHRCLFLKAYVQSYDEMIKFEEIEKLYLQVINETITDQETTINAMISYICLLIKRYTKIKEKNLLERIKYYNERLSKLATKQQSKLLFVEFYWIKSIVALFDGDQITSNELSTQAKNMAKEMSFIRLLNKMKNFTLNS